ncbi:hypothetical protein GCM10009413_20930 [Tatumella punctata]
MRITGREMVTGPQKDKKNALYRRAKTTHSNKCFATFLGVSENINNYHKVIYLPDL